VIVSAVRLVVNLLPGVSPYHFYCRWYSLLPIIFRLQMLGPATVKIVQRHRGNLWWIGDNALWVTKNITWMFELLWEIEGGKRLIINLLGGFILPIFLFNLSTMSPDGYGWDTWRKTPISSAFIFIFCLAVVLTWDFTLILETRMAMDELDQTLTTLGKNKKVIGLGRSITTRLACTYQRGKNGGIFARFKGYVAKSLLKTGASGMVDEFNESLMSYQTILLLYILKQSFPLVVLGVLAWIDVRYSFLWSILIIGISYQLFLWGQREGHIKDRDIERALNIISVLDISDQFFVLSDWIDWRMTLGRWKEIFMEGKLILKEGKYAVNVLVSPDDEKDADNPFKELKNREEKRKK